MSRFLLMLCLLAGAQSAVAQLVYAPKSAIASGDSTQPVTRIDIYVLPYYESARLPGDSPTVAVHPSFDALLKSKKQEDILAVRDAIRSAPATITPMTLMVLAIRLYDIGLRDESVFWFYAAKDRYIALSEVLDVKSAALAQVDDAMHSFVALAGPVFNSYAFCDIAKQHEAKIASVDWVEKNPYQATFMPQLPAKPGDRQKNLEAAIALLRANAQKEHDYFSDPKVLEEFNAKRKKNNVPAQFCWH